MSDLVRPTYLCRVWIEMQTKLYLIRVERVKLDERMTAEARAGVPWDRAVGHMTQSENGIDAEGKARDLIATLIDVDPGEFNVVIMFTGGVKVK